MQTIKMAITAVLVTALLAAACSSDDVASTDDVSPATTAAPADTIAPGGSADISEPTTSVPQALPASARGVTETSIKVGVAVPDFDALQAAGISNYQGDADIAFQAFFDQINASGGIFGRQIEPVYASFDWTRPETQDSACTELAEDNEVFIVLYGLLSDNNLCLTDRHDTMVMTRSFQTTDQRERSGDTLWLQLNAADDERTRIMGQALAESGRLDGKTIGILASATQNDGVEGDALQDALTEVGLASTVIRLDAPGDDPLARDAELKIVAERLAADGVDFVFDLIGGGGTADVFAASGYSPELAFKALGAAVDGSQDRSLMDGALSVAEITEQLIFDDPEFQANCMDVVLADHPELADEFAYLPTGDQQAAGEPNWANPVMIACDQTMLLKQLGEIAGADLTNDTFRAALDQLGPVTLHGYGQASFNSESKWDGLDEFYVQEYDFATDEISLVGEAIVIDRSG